MLSERISGEEPLHQDFRALSESKHQPRSVSQKLRKKNPRGRDEEDNDLSTVSFKCLPVYSRGGGCKVGADTGEEYGDTRSRRSIASEEGKGHKTICGIEETGVACFSYGMEFWKKNNQKYSEIEKSVSNGGMHIFLPDDILEMCLVRLPFASLMMARLVCKKWRYLTTTSRFLQMRRKGLYQSPWLFLFGTVKNGYCSEEIHALDVSQGQWHKIEADILKGRFMFSVTSIRDDIYIVGGCSSLTCFGRLDKSSFKTHKGVLVFSPLTKSWRKVASMKYARSMPILGISEVSSNCSVVQSHQNRQIGSVSDVYEDPHQLSTRHQCRSVSEDYEASFLASRKSHKFIRQKHDQSSAKACKKFVLIVLGGLGSWDEPLDSAEIYDSVSNKWTEIQRLPIDFGIVCAGVICNGMFYVYSDIDKLMAYNIDRDYWVGIQTSPFPPCIHEYQPELVSCNGRLFMISVSWCEGDGQIGQRNKAVRKLWELDLTYLIWTEVSVHPDAPMDWNAVFVADKETIFGVEMFKIFGQVLDFMTMCNVSNMETNWSHISRNQMANDLDTTSCMTKSMVVLHL